MRGRARRLYLCGRTNFSQLAALRARIGVRPGELIFSGAGGLTGWFHIRRQRRRIGRHRLIDLGLEIGRLFDQDRRNSGLLVDLANLRSVVA